MVHSLYLIPQEDYLLKDRYDRNGMLHAKQHETNLCSVHPRSSATDCENSGDADIVAHNSHTFSYDAQRWSLHNGAQCWL